jgi:hypothetical protein
VRMANDPNIDDAAVLARNAMRLFLEGKPTGNLAEWAAATKVVDFVDTRRKLRPTPNTELHVVRQD